MTIEEFIEQLKKTPEVELINENDDNRIVVRHKPSEVYTCILRDIVPTETWHRLWQIITGDQLVDPIYHVTRIVGYFSRVENWNKSKIGEYNDRKKGNYEINYDGWPRTDRDEKNP